jgi:RNA polymerase sigma factor (sigma-70 family)
MPAPVTRRLPLTRVQRDLVESHVRFAISIAKKYFRNGDQDDLVAEAYMGLCLAATKFDASRGFTFMTYSVYWIRAMILQYLMRHRGPVRFGSNRDDRKVFLGIGKALNALGVEGWDDSEAMAGHIGVDVDTFKHMRKRLQGHNGDLYLDHEIFREVADTAESVEETYGTHEHSIYTRVVIDEVLDTISPREKKILTWLYLEEEPYTLQEIGERLGLSRERVRQIKESAMKKVRLRMAKLYDPA